MTDADMIESSRAIALVLETVSTSKGLSPDDAAALASMALGELLAQYLGPVGAVERLRDVADLLERQILGGMQ